MLEGKIYHQNHFKFSCIDPIRSAREANAYQQKQEIIWKHIYKNVQQIRANGPFLSSSRAISCFACFIHDINYTSLGHLAKSSERFLQSWCTVRAVVLWHLKNVQLIQLQQKKQHEKIGKHNLTQIEGTISFSLGTWGSGVSGTAVDATWSSWSSPPSASNDPASLSGCGLGGKGCRRRTAALP